MRIAVIGTGYVGLVAGAGFSDFGHDVWCVDIDADRVRRLAGGEVPFHEPGLPELVGRNTAAGRLRFTTESTQAIAGADVVVIAVGTPSNPHDGSADLRFVDEAARSIGRALTGFAVIVTKSTVPVGTADRIRAIIATETRHEHAIASNPEFLKEGDAVADFMKPARVVLGVDDPRAEKILRALYAPLIRLSDRILVMSVRSAELTKYASNAMLAVRISFMNEMALLAEQVGADIESIRKAVGADPRIGPRFLFAGPGFGGSCFPKDLRALALTSREAGLTAEVVEAADRANRRQKQVLAERVRAHFGTVRGRRIAVWGLAFKPETDDLREAPALDLIRALLDDGATVVAYDPVAMPGARTLLGDTVELAPTMYAATEGADAVVVVTEWKQFRGADLRRLRAAMAAPVIFDGRNIWDPATARELGFSYYGIGRP